MPKQKPSKSLFSEEYDSFLEALKAARVAAELTQNDAAKRMGRLQSYVSKCESGERRVDVIELIQFCKAYNINPPHFVKKLITAKPW